ncbi:MAG: AAA family ATPase [Candidatus Lokiarchaeota archaeon]|nr:AAA family ATPase [Candidatus Lokiarchaeota archaeon]
MTFTKEEIKTRLEKYGTVYFPNDIIDKPEDLLGLDKNKEMLEDFFKALKNYKKYAKKLRELRMTPSISVLLYGPPGTGKTSLTRALAKKYKIPMCVVEADRLVSPLLGDTLKNMRNVVELSGEIAKENGLFLLFFDELDAIASERSSVNEVGEIKRGVISFLQILDRIDYEGIPLAIFGATNHQSQLDSAVWRRFTFHAYFGFPDFIIRKEILIKYLERLEQTQIEVDNTIYTQLEDELKLLKKEYQSIKKKSITSVNRFEFEDIFADKNKGKTIGILTSTRGYTGADLQRGMRVSLLKGIQKGLLKYEDLLDSLKFVGGTRIHVKQQQLLSGNEEHKEIYYSKSNNKNTQDINKSNKKKPLEI